MAGRASLILMPTIAGRCGRSWSSWAFRCGRCCEFGHQMTEDRRKMLAGIAGDLRRPVECVPEWVVMGVALCLGLGTMVALEADRGHGRREDRQDTSFVCPRRRGGACGRGHDPAWPMRFGLPVSTTHVLSSGVAGTMWANRSGIQASTCREICGWHGLHAAGRDRRSRAASTGWPHSSSRDDGGRVWQRRPRGRDVCGFRGANTG